MQKKSVSNFSIAAAPVLILCGLLGLTSPARAGDENRACTDRMLHGDYGFTIEGRLAAPKATLQNGGGIPIRGVAMTHFDGRGNLTQVDHIVVTACRHQRTGRQAAAPIP